MPNRLTAAVREKLATDDKVYDPRKVIGPGVDAIIKTVTEKFKSLVLTVKRKTNFMMI